MNEINVPSPAPGLASLAQSARKDELKQARGVLIAIGLLTIAVNAFFLWNTEERVRAEFDKEVEKLRAQGMQIDPAKLDELVQSSVRSTRLLNGSFAVTGALFVVLGIVIYWQPVVVCISALVLYLGCNAVALMINPEALAQGLIIKVIIIVGLVRAVRAALAYQGPPAAAVTAPEPAV